MKPKIIGGHFTSHLAQFDIVLNMTNCQSKIENTIGVELVTMWPLVQEVDSSTERLNKLGTISVAKVIHDGKNITIINCYVKSKEPDQIKFSAFELTLFKAGLVANGVRKANSGICHIGIPILKHQNWPMYFSTIQKELDSNVIFIVDQEKPIPVQQKFQ